MKKYIYIFLLLILASLSLHAQSSEPLFAIKVSVQKAEALSKNASLAQKLSAGQLYAKPMLMVNYGKTATVRIEKDENNELELAVTPSKDGSVYDVSLLLKEKNTSQEWIKTNSQATSIQQGESVLFTTELNGNHYIMTIHGSAFSNLASAQNWLEQN